MKKMARLVLFFTLCFLALFLAAAAFGFLRLWIDSIRAIPARSLDILPALMDSARNALSLGLYLSLLLTLSYSSRQQIPIPMTILGLLILGSALTAGLSVGMNRAARMKTSAVVPGRTLGQPGLLLSRGDTAMVLLEEPVNPSGSRVVSIPNRPLIYQEQPVGPNNTILDLPPAPFRNGGSFVPGGIFADTALTARRFNSRLEEGFIPFITYVSSLIFLLASLRFILDFSNWPLANLFLGALAFRGILAFESFVNSRDIQELIVSLAGNRIPPPLITPCGFYAIGLLVMLYTVLAHLARDRRRWNE
jgi:hypothetical protein